MPEPTEPAAAARPAPARKRPVAKKKVAKKKVAKKKVLKTNVVIVGRGLLGKALAICVKNHWSIRRRFTVRLLPGRISHPRRKVARTSPKVIWALAVPAEALDAVLQSVLPSVVKGDVVLHTAPSLGPDALEAARARGAAVGVVYPVARLLTPARQLWSSPLHGAPFYFQGDARARGAAGLFPRTAYGTLIAAKPEDPVRSAAAARDVFATLAHALSAAVEQVSADAAGTLSGKQLRAVANALLKSLERSLRTLTPSEMVQAAKGPASTDV